MSAPSSRQLLARLRPWPRETSRQFFDRLEMLREEFADFEAGHREASGGNADAWIPIRLLPITGAVARLLAEADLIEVLGDVARPVGDRP
jgi:hypothetical protein